MVQKSIKNYGHVLELLGLEVFMHTCFTHTLNRNLSLYLHKKIFILNYWVVLRNL